MIATPAKSEITSSLLTTSEGNIKNSLAESSEQFAKQTKRRSFWSFLGCCENEDSHNILDIPSKHKNGSKQSTFLTSANTHHYTDSTLSIEGCKGTLTPCSVSGTGHISKHNPVYVLNELFFLGCGSNKIISKIQRVILKRTAPNSNPQSLLVNRIMGHQLPEEGQTTKLIQPISNEHYFSRDEIFSLYDKGIKVDSTQWDEITPELVARHIAQQLEGMFIIDALCGCGGNTIQFGNYCKFVMAIDINSHFVNFAQNNSRVYQNSSSIDFLRGDFLRLGKLTADVVFLCPSQLKPKKDEAFSIFKHLEPNITSLVHHSLEIAPNICIKLPWQTSLEEVGILFSKIYMTDPASHVSNEYKVKIEQIFLDNVQDSIVVYFGPCNKINNQNANAFVYEHFCLHESTEFKKQYSFDFMGRLIDHVGLYNITLAIAAEEEKALLHDIYTNSIFDSVVKRLIENESLTQQTFRELLDERCSLPSPISFNLQMPRTTSKDLSALNILTLIKELPSLENSDLVTPNPGVPKKNTLLINLAEATSLNEDSIFNKGGDMTEDDLYLYLLPASRQIYRSTLTVRTGRESEFSMQEVSPHSGAELSELALSSYTLKSGALLDSASESLENSSSRLLSFEDGRSLRLSHVIDKVTGKGNHWSMSPARFIGESPKYSISPRPTFSPKRAKKALRKNLSVSNLKIKETPQSSEDMF